MKSITSRASKSSFVFIAAMAAFSVLAGLPASGWLVRQQLRMYFTDGGMPGLDSGRPAELERLRKCEFAIVAARPDDFPLGFACALEHADPPPEKDTDIPSARRKSSGNITDPHVIALLPLQGRFATRVPLEAAILRYSSLDDFSLTRRESTLETPTGELVSPMHLPMARPAKPAASVVLVASTAIRGEVLDPDNAYFPTMLAAALFAEERDRDAFIALERASHKARWDDYTSEEIKSRTRLLTAVTGDEPGSGGRLLTCLATPRTSAPFQAMARIIAVLAARREVAGDKEGGFALRHSLSHVGALMRATSPNISTNVLGVGITHVSSGRINGAPLSRTSSASAERDAKYVAYMTQIGHSDEASWYLAECTAGARAIGIRRAAEQKTDSFAMYMLSAIWWFACGLVLKVLLTLIVTLAASHGFSTLFKVCKFRPASRSIEGTYKFRRRAKYAIGILVMLYGITCVGTLVEDSAVRRVVQGRLAEEGQFDAREIGAAWPGPTPVAGTSGTAETKK